ncbi:hypothetical protein RUND412_009711 [Rhizina undulata]
MVGKDNDNTITGGTTPRPRQIKSRNGCTNCKVRRLKCDETIPECHQCIKRGLACPGYVKQLQWVTKYEKYMGPDTKASVKAETKRRRNAKVARTRAKGGRSSSEESTAVVSPPATTTMSSPVTEATLGAESPLTEDMGWEGKLGIQDGGEFSTGFEAVCGIDTDISPKTSSEVVHNAVEIAYSPTPSSMVSIIEHQPTVLIEYYFRKVCTIFCCFDSSSNPFRVQISHMVKDSKTLYHAIQGMAAAHMSKYRPEMVKDGYEHQNEAMRALTTECQALGVRVERVREETLLGIVVLGMTSAWHDPSVLGTAHLRPARLLVTAWLSTLDTTKTTAQQSFIIGIMAYWEMLASFISETDSDPDPKNSSPLAYLDPHISRLQHTSSSSGKIIPNPWSGIATEVFPMFAKIGGLARKRVLGGFLDETDRAMTESVELELLKWKCPDVDSIEDVGDANTPVQHLISIAEAYRYAALLQLYRGFPELLLKRLPRENSVAAEFDLFGGWFNGPHHHDDREYEFEFGDRVNAAEGKRKAQARRFLSALAIEILRILKGIPSKSGTKAIQPILVLQASNELHINPPPKTYRYLFSPSYSPFFYEDSCSGLLQPTILSIVEDAGPSPPSSCLPPQTDFELETMLYWRGFAQERILLLEQYMGLKTSSSIVALMMEVWRRMDAAGREGECYWLSVMVENGWETNLG